MTDRRILLDRFVASWHARDVAGVLAMFADGFEYRSASTHSASAEAMIAFAQEMWRGTPDERLELVNVIVQGDRVAAEVRTTATHSGQLDLAGLSFPATGRSLAIMSVWVLTFAGDHIATWNEYGSLKSWVEQMGATVTITPHDA